MSDGRTCGSGYEVTIFLDAILIFLTLLPKVQEQFNRILSEIIDCLAYNAREWSIPCERCPWHINNMIVERV